MGAGSYSGLMRGSQNATLCQSDLSVLICILAVERANTDGNRVWAFGPPQQGVIGDEGFGACEAGD